MHAQVLYIYFFVNEPSSIHLSTSFTSPTCLYIYVHAALYHGPLHHTCFSLILSITRGAYIYMCAHVLPSSADTLFAFYTCLHNSLLRFSYERSSLFFDRDVYMYTIRPNVPRRGREKERASIARRRFIGRKSIRIY